MQGNPVTEAQLKAARSAAGPQGHHHVHRALDLIEYSNEYAKAVEFVLGGVLICSDLNIANKVCSS